VIAFTPLYEAFETAPVIVTGLPAVVLDGVRAGPCGVIDQSIDLLRQRLSGLVALRWVVFAIMRHFCVSIRLAPISGPIPWRSHARSRSDTTSALSLYGGGDGLDVRVISIAGADLLPQQPRGFRVVACRN
jgi:hypothetical protein